MLIEHQSDRRIVSLLRLTTIAKTLAGDEAVAELGRPVVERVVEKPKDGLGQGKGGAVLRIGRLQL